MSGSETGSNALIIPEGINYECMGCGKCCSGWSVPLTAPDYERISKVDWAAKNDKFAGLDLFRELKDYERKGSPYTHAIKHGDDGFCPFLVNNLCYIHSTFESKTKPSICQLFPYNFNETPSGFISTVSFVSVGAVKNSGKPLTEQREYLESKLGEFKALYPDHHPNWSKIELVKEVPLSWNEYLEIETKLLAILSDRSQSLSLRLAHMSLAIVEIYLGKRGSSLPESQKQIDLSRHSLKKGDHVLLRELYRLYFPERLLNRADMNFSASKYMFASFASKLGMGSPLSLKVPGDSYSLAAVKEIAFPAEEVLDGILYRFIYQRIFGKLYFGAGYGQLSLMVGFHHLVAAYVLLKLQARAVSLSRGFKSVQEADLISCVRMLEKRLGDSSLDGYAAAVVELELQSHGRCLRVLSIAD